MGKESAGAAKEQMNTWNGMISNMGDHWKLFQKDVMGSGAFTVLKDQLGEFLGMLDEMKRLANTTSLSIKSGVILLRPLNQPLLLQEKLKRSVRNYGL